MNASGSGRKKGKGPRPVPGSVPFEPSAALRKELARLLDQLPNKQAATVPLLLTIQEECGVVSPEAEAWVAESLEAPPVKIREVVSFYSMLKEQPEGRRQPPVAGPATILAALSVTAKAAYRHGRRPAVPIPIEDAVQSRRHLGMPGPARHLDGPLLPEDRSLEARWGPLVLRSGGSPEVGRVPRTGETPPAPLLHGGGYGLGRITARRSGRKRRGGGRPS